MPPQIAADDASGTEGMSEDWAIVGQVVRLLVDLGQEPDGCGQPLLARARRCGL